MADEPEILGYSYELPLEQPAKPRRHGLIARLDQRWKRRLAVLLLALPVLTLLFLGGLLIGVREQLHKGYQALRDVWKL